MYTVKEVNLMPGQRSSIPGGIYSGKFLTTVGINPVVGAGDRASVIISIEEKK
jgi:hypothetical protein